MSKRYSGANWQIVCAHCRANISDENPTKNCVTCNSECCEKCLPAEVQNAALRARPAMAWRRREDVGEVFEGDRFLAAVHVRDTSSGKDVFYWEYDCVKIDESGHLLHLEGDDWGWRFSDVDFVIPWSDLMPPGGEGAR